MSLGDWNKYKHIIIKNILIYMFGRVGVISAAARRRRQESYKFGKTT